MSIILFRKSVNQQLTAKKAKVTWHDHLHQAEAGLNQSCWKGELMATTEYGLYPNSLRSHWNSPVSL